MPRRLGRGMGDEQFGLFWLFSPHRHGLLSLPHQEALVDPWIGYVLHQINRQLAQKNFDEALEAYTMMQSIAKSLYIEDPKDSYSLTRLMVSYGSEADVYFQRGDFVQATAKTEKAMKLQSRLTQLVPSPERHQEAFIGHVMLASNYAYQENWLQCASHRDVAERLFKTFSLVVQKVPEIAYREAHLRQLVQVYPRCRID